MSLNVIDNRLTDCLITGDSNTGTLSWCHNPTNPEKVKPRCSRFTVHPVTKNLLVTKHVMLFPISHSHRVKFRPGTSRTASSHLPPVPPGSTILHCNVPKFKATKFKGYIKFVVLHLY